MSVQDHICYDNDHLISVWHKQDIALTFSVINILAHFFLIKGFCFLSAITFDSKW